MRSVSRFSRLLSVLFVLTAGFAGPAPAEEGRWESIGPDGGPISALAVAPGAPRTVYAGTDSGRLFRSVDAGATWTELRDLRPSPIADLEVDPRDPSTVYAASCTRSSFEDLGGLFKSVDGGATWDLLEGLEPCRVRDVAIDPRNPDRLFAATEVGLYQSDNGGASWRAHRGRPGRGGVRAVVFDPAAPATVYLLHEQAGFLKSANGGAGWALQNTGLPADHGKLAGLAVSPRLPKTLYIRTTAAGVAPVYRSVNGGQSWAAASNGLGARTANDLVVSASGAVYAATADGVFRSTDRGRTWTAPAPGTAVAAARELAVPVAPAAVVYAGSTRGVFKSANAGQAWQESSRGMTANAVAQIEIAPSDGAVLYARTFYGVVASVNGGTAWRDAVRGIAGPPATLAVHPDEPRTAFVTADQGVVWKTADAGLTWRQLAEPVACLSPIAMAVDPAIPDNLYVVGFGIRCFGSDLIPFCGGIRSSDGGASWTCMRDLDRVILASLAVAPGSPSKLYAGVNGGVPDPLYQSADAGQTWDNPRVGLAGPIFSIAVSPADPRTVLTITLNGLYKSVDGGVTWNRVSAAGLPVGLLYHDLLFAPADSSRLYVVADVSLGDDVVYRSADGGASWSQVPRDGLPEVEGGRISSLAVSPTDPRTLYAATPSGVFKVTLPE